MSSQRDRLARLLFIVPQLVKRKDGMPVDELADLLGITEVQLESDIGLLSMVGQPPLTPDHLIDLYIEDGLVHVDLDQSLTRPLRLTHEEAEALAISARLVGALGGLGQELESVVRRIIGHLNPVEQRTVTSLTERVHIAHDGPAHSEPALRLRQAIAERREVEVWYYSASSDRLKEYTLAPLALIGHSGIEYVVSLDQGAQSQQKLFRLDRFGDIKMTDRTFEPAEDLNLENYRTREIFMSEPDDPPEVRFAPEIADEVQKRFPEWTFQSGADGSVTAKLPTQNAAWMARWVLPFGTAAEVVRPAHLRMRMHALCVEAAKFYQG